MNISYNWLKKYLALTDDAETVAKNLTSIGLEVGTVEKVQTIKGGLEGLVVGEVLTCVEHPNSDHLHITTTDYGQGPVQIVCGAPNVAAGQKVVVATIGTRLYDGEDSFVIKRGKIRGEESLGMLCAEDEIGVGSSHDGIIVLPADVPVGTLAKDYYHVEDDTLIEVDITPNRSDAASHYGVARDLYAFYQAHGQNVTLTKPSVEAFKVDNHDLEIKVTVENTCACPRYTGVSIKGVEVKESPDWLKKHLTTIGLRPINNVVDVTNFVLHEMGQALHAFDADKIRGNQVVVKNAVEGSKFTTLDGVEHTMSAADLMICNAEEPMCIAGVFGGLDSGVTEKTKNVFLESAYFEPVTIRKTSRRHQIQTDASFRYERGADPLATEWAAWRAANLICECAGAKVVGGLQKVYGEDMARKQVELDYDRIESFIGKEIGHSTIEKILEYLQYEFLNKREGGATVAVPSYMIDVYRECDVVEEILRIYGYNNIELPSSIHSSVNPSAHPEPEAVRNMISNFLASNGFNEIMNNSLTKGAYYAELQSYPAEKLVSIVNPLSSDLNVMRQSLVPGGLEVIAYNINRQCNSMKLFEYGSVYSLKEPGIVPCVFNGIPGVQLVCLEKKL